MGMDKTYLPSNVSINMPRIGLPSNVSIHMPRIGCGLAGGNWDAVAPIIEATLGYYFDVYVYDLPKDEERDEFDNLIKDIREGKI